MQVEEAVSSAVIKAEPTYTYPPRHEAGKATTRSYPVYDVYDLYEPYEPKKSKPVRTLSSSKTSKYQPSYGGRNA